MLAEDSLSRSAAMETAAGFGLNPFPGLRPFEPDEDYLFFGREKQIDELLRRLRGNRFLAILGTSGCGKSSLVRSGLIPSLIGGAMVGAGSSWRVALARPGGDPLGNLATALNAPGVLAPQEAAGELGRGFLEATLRASKRGIVECVEQAHLPEHDNLLVVIDQFEELFRFKQTSSRDDALAFAKLLLEGARHQPSRIYVALTMRSDFVGSCMEFTGLPEAVNEGLYLVPRMLRDELRTAIAGPVAVGGGAIAPRLVARLLNDVGDDPDQLPVLQHALMRTWERWRHDRSPGEPLDLRHYEAIGTMREALSRHCDEAFAELDASGQRIAELTWKALTDRGTDGRGLRRPAPLAEMAELTGAGTAAVAAVVERFRAPGRSFLMPPAGVELHAGTVLDLSHESLMRVWRRLAAWVEDEARSAQVYLGLARAAASHEAGTAALWRDPELQLASSWRDGQGPTAAWAGRYDPSFERAMRFLDASAAERDQEVARREELRRRELKRARTLALVLGTSALVTLALGGLAFTQKGRAEGERNRAEKALLEARAQKRIADVQTTRAEKQKGLAERERRIAEQERANAERHGRTAEEQRQIAEGERRKAVAEEGVARAKAAEALAARLEAEGRRSEALQQRERAEQLRATAETSERETRRLSMLSWAHATALSILHPQQAQANDLGALLAVQVFKLNRDNGGAVEDPELFAALRAALVRLGTDPDPVMRGHDDAVRAVAVGPNGWEVFSGGEDGKVRRLDLRHPEAPPAVLGSFGAGIRALSILAGGDLLAAGSSAGEVRLWDLRRPAAPPRELGLVAMESGGSGREHPAAGARARDGGGGGPLVSAFAFQPEGRLLASGAADGTVRLWDLDRAAAAGQLSTGGKRVLALAFSPDGALLAAGLGQGGGALVWQARQPAGEARPTCLGKDVRALAFSPDGKLLACGTGQGGVQLRNPWGPRAERDDTPAPAVRGVARNDIVIPGPATAVNFLRFSPDGGWLAAASGDGSARLWQLSHAAEPIVLQGHESWVWALAFSPDGTRLLTGGEDRTVHVWSPRSELLAARICRQVHRDLTAEERRRLLPAALANEKAATCPPGA
jgi:WD40 repeat protein/energy-coupling factor transporter ATP-binding protein EcfA2